MNRLPLQSPKTSPHSARADAQRNREAILAAARTVFALGGWQAEMSQVAAEAGVGVGTVYRHFPSKDVLAGELLAARYRLMCQQAEQIAATDHAAFEQLEAALWANAEHLASDPLARHALNRAGPAATAHAEADRLQLEQAFVPMIDRAHAAGTLRSDFTLPRVATLMTAVCATMSDDSPREWKLILRVFLDGLAS